MTETKTAVATSLEDALWAFHNLVNGALDIDGGKYLLRLFGVKTIEDLPARQLGEFVRLCQLGMSSRSLEEFKQAIRADAGPSSPTYEDVLDAIGALRRRLNDDAVRFLCRSFGDSESNIGRQYTESFRQTVIRCSRIEANTAEEFWFALMDSEREDRWIREARTPLPGDLRVLALEYAYKSSIEFPDMLSVLTKIGIASDHGPAETTIFGKAPKRRSNEKRIRVDIITTQSNLDRWLGNEVENRFSFGWAELPLINHKVLDSLAHRYEVGDEYLCDDKLLWRGVEPESDEPGQFVGWAKSAALVDRDLEQFMQFRDACNGRIGAMLEALNRQEDNLTGPQQYLVEGLIPKSVVTLLLAKQKVGKTNAMLELAVAVARRDSEWLGFPVKTGRGFAVYLFGEGSREDAEERIRTMAGGELPTLLNLMPYDGTGLDDILQSLSEINVDLLIVDPARKFYKGDEDGSDAVSEFFTKMEEFARRKQAAVVVTHHLKRESAPKSIHDVPRCMRGSQVFLDRPRVVLAMRRAGTETQFGIPAPDGQPLHNFRASKMFSGIRRLRRDEATFRHVVLGTADATNSSAASLVPDAGTAGDVADVTTAEVLPDDVQRVRAAVASLIAEGQRVTSRGKRELYKLKPLNGISRLATRAAIEQLESDGVLRRDASGALMVSG